MFTHRLPKLSLITRVNGADGSRTERRSSSCGAGMACEERKLYTRGYYSSRDTGRRHHQDQGQHYFHRSSTHLRIALSACIQFGHRKCHGGPREIWRSLKYPSSIPKTATNRRKGVIVPRLYVYYSTPYVPYNHPTTYKRYWAVVIRFMCNVYRPSQIDHAHEHNQTVTILHYLGIYSICDSCSDTSCRLETVYGTPSVLLQWPASIVLREHINASM